ncbi:MAG: hypothetical protein ACTJLM_04565 [Ehrlichia sp.]
MESRNKANIYHKSNYNGFIKKVITIQNNLKYRVQYIILKEFSDQYKTITNESISTYQRRLLCKVIPVQHVIIKELVDTIHNYARYKTFFSYGEYLKSLYDIYRSRIIYSQDDTLQYTNGAINIRSITIDNISDTMNPLLENGCEIKIKSDIPEYFSIFLETSNITICGTVHGTVFNKYGSITITNAKECTGNMVTVFGTLSINGKILNRSLQHMLFVPTNFCEKNKTQFYNDQKNK